MVENRRSCWFYDHQLNNRLTSISLHANTRYDEDSATWIKATDDHYNHRYGGVDEGGYYMNPLCRSVLMEDFNVTIGNTWTDLGGDPISGLVNDVMHSAAPYANAISGAIKKIGDMAEEWKGENKNKIEYDENGNQKFSLASTVANWATTAKKVVDKHGDEVIDFMNSNLIMQGTRFSYYGGTGLSFGNLSMRFTLFPKWVDGGFLTVNQQLEDLLPYAIGKYETLKFKAKNKAGEEKEYASDVIGWQRPPAGYRADYKDIDNKALKGTLKLRIGAFYVLEGLVCENLNFNMSRQMVKKPEGVGFSRLNAGSDRILKVDAGTINFSPLFADVTMVFRAATKYSDTVMRNFIYGLNMAGDANETAKILNQDMTSKLKTIRDEIRSKYWK